MATYYVSEDYVADKYAQSDISINWVTGEIFVPKFFSTLVQTDPIEVRDLDIDLFRLKLRDLEDDIEGRPWPKTHTHNTQVVLSGITYARVIEILSPYTITFEDGQYAINLSGANSNIADKVNINNVSIRSANSAGLQSLDVILASAYQGFVCIDLLNSTGLATAGTSIPVGTRAVPSNNLADAATIALKNSIQQFAILSDMILEPTSVLNGYAFVGDNPLTVTLDLPTGALIENCEFRNLTITGDLDGGSNLQLCSITDLTVSRGFMFECALSGNLTLEPGSRLAMFQCFTGAGELTPIINIGGTGTLTAQHISGNYKIINSDGTGEIYVNMQGGDLEIGNTITGGSIYIHNASTVTDNSTGTAVVYDNSINKAIADVQTDVDFILDIEGGKWEVVNNQMIFYSSDNVTEISRFNMFDINGNPTTTSEFYKRERV